MPQAVDQEERITVYFRDSQGLVRTRICEGLGRLGIELEERQKAAHEGLIVAAASRIAARVIHTDEERMIARSECHVFHFGADEDKET